MLFRSRPSPTPPLPTHPSPPPLYRFLPLILAEQQTESKVIVARLASYGTERLQREGYCVTGLDAFWLEKTSLGRPVAGFRCSSGSALPFNVFMWVFFAVFLGGGDGGVAVLWFC